MADELPDLDQDALWDAVGGRDWTRAEDLLKTAGYDLEDLGALAVMDRDGESE
jgi:hypothetical protein